MTTTLVRYLTCANTAKLVRKALKREFPGQKFSVRSDVYSGGASIDVRWTDGPRPADVDPVVKQFAGGRFDGSIDLAYSVTHYLRPDGEAMVERNPGTIGRMGSDPGYSNEHLADLMPEGVEVVHFAADYVFTHREVSDYQADKDAAIAWLYANTNGDATYTGDPNRDRFGNRWIDGIANMMVHDSIKGEDWQTAFDRLYHPY